MELVPSVLYDVAGWQVTGAKGSAVVGWLTGSTRYELPSRMYGGLPENWAMPEGYFWYFSVRATMSCATYP
jgi:hypothetical protein